MKICVLFGSFNPLTKAHVSALKTAVEAIRADKGLFVPTNGQYLKRKTIKINDPFAKKTSPWKKWLRAIVALAVVGCGLWLFNLLSWAGLQSPLPRYNQPAAAVECCTDTCCSDTAETAAEEVVAE